MANSLKYHQKTFSVGDTIQVYQLVKEGDKERTQMFEGILIGVKGREKNKSFTVRKIATGAIGVERIWPLFSPVIIDIKRKKTGRARRAKLYYLRSRTGKQAIKMKERAEKEVKESSAPSPPAGGSVPSVTKKSILAKGASGAKQKVRGSPRRKPRQTASKK